MLRRFFGCGLLTALTLTLSLTTYGGDKSQPKLPTPPPNAALEKMKKLAGTWLLADKDGTLTALDQEGLIPEPSRNARYYRVESNTERQQQSKGAYVFHKRLSPRGWSAWAK